MEAEDGMYRLWEPVILPILEVVRPEVLIEIGSDEGYSTKHLLDYCKRADAVVHSIDPYPKYDPEEWVGRYRESLQFHRGLSLEILPTLESADLVLIDGDHNWYTVFNELRVLEQLAAAGRKAFPITLLHDVGWPYGRRDLYYDPKGIPAEYRHAHDRVGLLPDSEGVHPDGMNRHLHNALQEGAARSGVLTAVEDFLAESSQDLELVVLPTVHGLGILFPVSARETSPAFAALIDRLSVGHETYKLLETSERLRLDAELRRIRAERGIEEVQRSISELTRELQAARARTATERAKYQAQLSKTQKQLDRLRSRRSVRAVLAAGRLVRPGFKAIRRLKSRGARSILDRQHVAQLPTRPADAEVEQATADIVVCVHNALEDVDRCLASVVAHTDLDRHGLVIVDDGSDAETQGFLERFAAEHDVKLVRHEEARGYTKAANQGLRQTSAPYAVLLNSDTIVTPGWLDRLLRCSLSYPDTAVVGPLSNAASWQSIPELHDPEGGWCVNELPEGWGPDDVARVLERWSPRLYPSVPLVNGFCYVVSRQALDRVGLFDEEHFPRGYGEEDDFSLRCAGAGLSRYIADDCYVFHAKSKSYSSEGRSEIVESSKQALRQKHGSGRVRDAVGEVGTSEDLVRARAFVSEALKWELAHQEPVEFEEALPSVAWVVPHLLEVGGNRRVIEMTNRLAEWGFDIKIVCQDGRRPTWLPVRSEILPVDAARERGFDVVIASDPDVMGSVLELTAKTRVNYHLGAYMLYRDADDSLSEYYEASNGFVHITNSRWTAEQVESHTGVTVDGIFPGGVDKRSFAPRPVERTHDVVCYGTKRLHKGTPTIEAACVGRRLLKLADASPAQSELASFIGAGRVFASACWHEGFNFLPVEAMACGIPVVMTDDGGSREYAVDGENALVVPVGDFDAMRKAIERVLEDRDLRIHLIQEGMRTSWRFDWDDVTRDFARFLIQL